MEKLKLLGLRPEDLVTALAGRGGTISLDEARRVVAHLVSGGAADLDGMKRPVHKDRRALLSEQTRWDRPVVEARVEDPLDHSVRYLFRAEDGARFEAVRIPLHRPGRFSVCLSSQVGCAMRCAFCATGRLGLRRNLDAAEMVAAFCAVRDEAPGRVSGAVFMGQGEPFHNYDAVLQAAAVLRDPCGGRIDQKAISISTVGLPAMIRRYTAEGHRYRLIVSLHSALPARRAALVPTAGRGSLDELADALRGWHAATGERVTVAWVVLGGVNTGPEEAEALHALLGDLPLRVNLIDVNDSRPDGWRRASDAERRAFLDALQILKAPLVRRYSVGASQASACGMLAATAQP